MPPRSGQLDEISERIGRLDGRFDGIERYMHEREHGLNNLAQKVDGIGTLISREIAAVEARMLVRFEQVEERVGALEVEKHHRDGAVGLVTWFAKHWPFTVILAALAAWVAWANGRI